MAPAAKKAKIEAKPPVSKKGSNKASVLNKKISKNGTLTANSIRSANAKPRITSPPSQVLDIYVFGTGEYGELGLGPTSTTVKGPRLNHLLDANSVRVVQVAVGGMHCIALTQDQRILTWGVNDNGALGRDTLPAAAANGDNTDDEDGLNPKESTPTAIPQEFFGPEKKTFTQVVASDSASFALTDDGSVYGWGTFSENDGALGFSIADAIIAQRDKIDELKYQQRPALIPQLKKIKLLAAGSNHVQALDQKSNVFCWGTGEQSQLGRRILERHRALALTPRKLGLPANKVKYISCGAYHSFAIDDKGRAYAWGLNNFGQTGLMRGAGVNEASIITSTLIQSLKDFRIKEIQGGNHHSIACTEDGQVLSWGRCDDAQAGISLQYLPPEDLIFDSRNRARILTRPTVVPDLNGTFVAAGIDNSVAVNKDGEAYVWGFSSGYRTGLGSEESVESSTLLHNTAVSGKEITFVGCGGQFTVLAGPSASPRINGV